MTKDELIRDYEKLIDDQGKMIKSCIELISNYEEQLNAPRPLVHQGLLDYEIMLEHLKKKTGEPMEFDTLKISDKERRERLGARIKLFRKALGLKQTDLAAKLSVSPQAIAIYETGKREPNLKNLIQLSRALQTTTDALLGEPPRK